MQKKLEIWFLTGGGPEVNKYLLAVKWHHHSWLLNIRAVPVLWKIQKCFYFHLSDLWFRLWLFQKPKPKKLFSIHLQLWLADRMMPLRRKRAPRKSILTGDTSLDHVKWRSKKINNFKGRVVGTKILETIKLCRILTLRILATAMQLKVPPAFC